MISLAYNQIELNTAYCLYRVIYQLILWPYILSPLRSVPGPPAGNILIGQFHKIIYSETGIPHRQWVKEYGPVVRATGPIGIERLIFMRPEALHQILVSDWLDNPRVCLNSLRGQSIDLRGNEACFYEKYIRLGCWLWAADCHRK